MLKNCYNIAFSSWIVSREPSNTLLMSTTSFSLLMPPSFATPPPCSYKSSFSLPFFITPFSPPLPCPTNYHPTSPCPPSHSCPTRCRTSVGVFRLIFRTKFGVGFEPKDQIVHIISMLNMKIQNLTHGYLKIEVI